jgi:acid phosphatase
MENQPASAIYGSSKAPYINGLMAKYTHASAFGDPLPDSIPSEPHYVWMEAGTNKFSDVTFTGDSDPSAGNSTASTAHLVTQMKTASPAVSWLGFMQGLNSSTGLCPVRSSGFYGAKHDPFVFFQDVAGSPPSTTNAYCAAHHQPFTAFAQALAQGTAAQYNFISPDVCNDMHGDSSCPSGDPITLGDQWLQANLPPLIDYVNANSGVIFLVWDEPEGGGSLIPFLAIGPHVKTGYTSSVAYTHSSLTKSVEEVFNLPILPTVAGASDFKDVFQPGFFP